MLGVISAVGGCAQIIKSLYQYYDLHKQNKALLDILEGFSQNLEVVSVKEVHLHVPPELPCIGCG